MKPFIKIFLFLIILILFSEVSLRISGFEALTNKKESSKILSTPSPLFVVDSLLGYKYRIGKTKVTLNQSLEYYITVDTIGNRVNEYFNPQKENSLCIFGCSFFGGMGVNNHQVLSSFLSKKLAEFSVYNFSIAGHGMTSQYLKFKTLHQKEYNSEWAVFEIASFHLIRNVGAYNYIKNFFKIADAPMNFVVTKKEKDNLQFQKIDINKKIHWLERKSILFHEVKKLVKQIEYSEKYLLDVQTALMDSTYNLSIENNVKPLFVVITKDEITNKIVQHLKENNYPYIISNVDYNDDDYNLNPHDQHPNEKAHKKYAEEIYEYICKHESCY